MNKKYLVLLVFVFLEWLLGPKLSYATKPSDFGLKEGDLISAIFSDDPDVYIINVQGYKRLFLNPEIFKFYGHLGGFANVKLVTPEIRDSFPTSGFFRNCEDNDKKVYGVSVEGEDQGRLHWIDKSGEQAVQEDADFFKKVFCINRKEFSWYPRGNEFKALKEVPQYNRSTEAENPVICHHPSDDSNTFQTLRVASPSLDTHFQHGDTMGACPGSFAPTPVSTTVPTQPTELCYNCPSSVTLYPSNVCRNFGYSGEGFSLQENGFLNLLKDKGMKITGIPSGYAWSTRLSGTTGNTGEVIGFISPDRSEPHLGISDSETLIIELAGEFAQSVKIGLTVTPAATSNNIPATVSITALNQMGKTVDGLKQTFVGVTDNKLTPATFTLKAPTSEISKIIIQTSQYPSGGLWLKSVEATNACTTVSTPTPTITPMVTTSPSPTASLSYSPTPTPTSTNTQQVTTPTPTPTTTSSSLTPSPTATLSPTPTPTPTPTPLNGPTSCSSMSLTLNDGKTTYIKGADNFVNYTWTCTSGGLANVNVGIQKPTGNWVSLNSTTNSSTQTSSINISGDSYPAGTYRLSACFSYLVCGSQETAGRTFNISATLPDLSIYSFDLPSVVTVGQSVNLGTKVRNTGMATAPASILKVYFSNTPGETILNVPSISAGSSLWVYWSTVIPNSNTILFMATSDPDNQIMESDEYNNGAGQSITVSQPIPTPTSPLGSSSFQFDSNRSSNFATITRNLTIGSTGNDVKQLQALLVNEVNYPANLITGYFGYITRDAVKKLQEKYGVKPISGYFGEITRQVLKVLIYR